MLTGDGLRDLKSRLVDAVRAGTHVDLRSGDPEADRPNLARAWNPARTVHADTLVELITRLPEPSVGRLHSLRLTGARIEGTLDLSHTSVNCPLFFSYCNFDNPLDFSRAHTQTIRMIGCHVPGLSAHQIRTYGDIDLSRLTVNGEIGMIGASIDGQLILSGASLHNPGGMALHAEVAKIELGVFCDADFSADGEVCLIGARLGGYLRFSGARLSNPRGIALKAYNIAVDQDAYLDDGFSAEGEVNLLGAVVHGALSLRAAKLTNPGNNALTLDGAVVDQSVHCNDGFAVEGEVRLRGCRIQGHLSFDGAHLSNPGGCALSVDTSTVGNSVSFGNDFTAIGELSLGGTSIAGQLELGGARLSNPGGCAFSGESLRVAHDMFCDDGFIAEGEISLASAHVRRLGFSGATLTNPGGDALAASGITVDRGMFCRHGFRATGAVRLTHAHIGGQLDFTDARLMNPGQIALGLKGAQVATLVLSPGESPDGTVDLTNARVASFRDERATWPVAIQMRGFVYETLENDTIPVKDRLEWVARHSAGYVPGIYDQLSGAYRRAGRVEDARRVGLAKQRRRQREFGLAGKAWSEFLYWTIGYGYRTWLAAVWLVALLALGGVVFALSYPADFVPTAGVVPKFQPVAYALDTLLPVVDLGQQKAWLAQGAAPVCCWVLIASGWILATLVIAGMTNALKRD